MFSSKETIIITSPGDDNDDWDEVGINESRRRLPKMRSITKIFQAGEEESNFKSNDEPLTPTSSLASGTASILLPPSMKASGFRPRSKSLSFDGNESIRSSASRGSHSNRSLTNIYGKIPKITRQKNKGNNMQQYYGQKKNNVNNYPNANVIGNERNVVNIGVMDHNYHSNRVLANLDSPPNVQQPHTTNDAQQSTPGGSLKIPLSRGSSNATSLSAASSASLPPLHRISPKSSEASLFKRMKQTECYLNQQQQQLQPYSMQSNHQDGDYKGEMSNSLYLMHTNSNTLYPTQQKQDNHPHLQPNSKSMHASLRKESSQSEYENFNTMDGSYQSSTLSLVNYDDNTTLNRENSVDISSEGELLIDNDNDRTCLAGLKIESEHDVQISREYAEEEKAEIMEIKNNYSIDTIDHEFDHNDDSIDKLSLSPSISITPDLQVPGLSSKDLKSWTGDQNLLNQTSNILTDDYKRINAMQQLKHADFVDSRGRFFSYLNYSLPNSRKNEEFVDGRGRFFSRYVDQNGSESDLLKDVHSFAQDEEASSQNNVEVDEIASDNEHSENEIRMELHSEFVTPKKNVQFSKNDQQPTPYTQSKTPLKVSFSEQSSEFNGRASIAAPRPENGNSSGDNMLSPYDLLHWTCTPLSIFCCCKNPCFPDDLTAASKSNNIHFQRLHWSRISSIIVRYAPCFWCFCCFNKLESSATDRAILVRLNYMCAFFALAQVAVGIFVLIILLTDDILVDRFSTPSNAKLMNMTTNQGYDNGNNISEVDEILDGDDIKKGYYAEALTPNLWTPTGMLLIQGIAGSILLITTILTVPKIRRVNLTGALRYMWVLYWLIPLEIFLVIAMFDYHKVTDVWVRHWWAGPSMAWFRSVFCQNSTANSECAVPVLGGSNFNSETEWCLENFNSTDCMDIRTEATSMMSTVSYIFFYSSSIIGFFLVLLLMLCLTMIQGIISAPIVQASKETNVPLWLCLPTIGCIVCGTILLYSPSSLLSSDSGSSIYWIGVCYIVSGCTFFVSALLGWFISAKTVLDKRDKRQKQFAIFTFMIMMICTIFSVGAIFCASLIYSVDMVNIGLSDEERGSIACYVDTSNSCSNCNTSETVTELDTDLRECPEWSDEDVIRIIQTQLKQSASLASILLIYALFALRFGFVLKSLLANYEIDYV